MPAAMDASCFCLDSFFLASQIKMNISLIKEENQITDSDKLKISMGGVESIPNSSTVDFAILFSGRYSGKGLRKRRLPQKSHLLLLNWRFTGASLAKS